jgi:hypothetical protein
MNHRLLLWILSGERANKREYVGYVLSRRMTYSNLPLLPKQIPIALTRLINMMYPYSIYMV